MAILELIHASIHPNGLCGAGGWQTIDDFSSIYFCSMVSDCMIDLRVWFDKPLDRSLILLDRNQYNGMLIYRVDAQCDTGFAIRFIKI